MHRKWSNKNPSRLLNFGRFLRGVREGRRLFHLNYNNIKKSEME